MMTSALIVLDATGRRHPLAVAVGEHAGVSHRILVAARAALDVTSQCPFHVGMHGSPSKLPRSVSLSRATRQA